MIRRPPRSKLIASSAAQMCIRDRATSVDVEYMDESNSYWDSEEKEYLFKNYETAEVEISSNIEVTLRMDRTELDMRQNPMFELVEIECTPIESYIDEEY